MKTISSLFYARIQSYFFIIAVALFSGLFFSEHTVVFASFATFFLQVFFSLQV